MEFHLQNALFLNNWDIQHPNAVLCSCFLQSFPFCVYLTRSVVMTLKGVGILKKKEKNRLFSQQTEHNVNIMCVWSKVLVLVLFKASLVN